MLLTALPARLKVLVLIKHLIIGGKHALVQRLELDKDVKKNNWWLNERVKIMEVIDDLEAELAEDQRIIKKTNENI